VFFLFKKKYDYVITVAPPFHLGFLAWFYTKARGGKLVYHIQDLQIEAAQDLGILSNERLFSWLYGAERKILKGSDFVSSISDGMIRKIELKAGRDVLFFPNWVDTSSFFPITDSAALKQKWGYAPDQLVCLYSGSIGEKQGLENIIYCAEILKEQPQIKFVICGIGPYKDKLQNLVLAKDLKNVDFLPLQDKAVFNDFLNMADIHLVIQKGNASDLVMPSKLTTILAVGKVCIVTAPEDTSLYDLVNQHQVGFIVPPDDYQQLARVIQELAVKDLTIQKNNARNYALQYLNIDNVMRKFMADISNNNDK